MNKHFDRFKKIITNPIQFKFFLLSKLPAAFFAGLSIHEFTEAKAVVRVKHNGWTQNPFRSMYLRLNSFITLIFKNQTQRLCHKDCKPMIT